MAMMLDNVPPMEQERERKMKRKEGAPNEGIAAVDAESTWIKRTKQEIKVRMSENLPPLSPRAEQSFSSPGEYFDPYEEYEKGADMQEWSSWCWYQ